MTRRQGEAIEHFGRWEVFVEPNLPDDGPARDAKLAAPSSLGEHANFRWPWGVVAIGLMALAWVGVYLIWNGVGFLLNW